MTQNQNPRNVVEAHQINSNQGRGSVRIDIQGYSINHISRFPIFCRGLQTMNHNRTCQCRETGEDVSRMALESRAELEARNERIKTWLTFHDMLLTGVMWLYSRW